MGGFPYNVHMPDPLPHTHCCHLGWATAVSCLDRESGRLISLLPLPRVCVYFQRGLSVLSSLVSRSKSLLPAPPRPTAQEVSGFSVVHGVLCDPPPCPPTPTLSDIILYPSLFLRSLWPAGLLPTLLPQGLCSRVPISEMSLPTRHLPS